VVFGGFFMPLSTLFLAACLPWCMHHEIPLSLYQHEDVVEVEAAQRVVFCFQWKHNENMVFRWL
jgi:hypothetical protein